MTLHRMLTIAALNLTYLLGALSCALALQVADQIEKYSPSDFSQTGHSKPPLQVWTEIEFTSDPATAAESEHSSSFPVQSEFRVLRFFADKDSSPGKTGTIQLIVAPDDPNRPRKPEGRPSKRPVLATAPAKGSKAIVLLEIRLVTSGVERAADEDPFAPDTDTKPKKPPPPTRIEFSPREICLESNPKYQEWRSIAAACDAAINGDKRDASAIMLEELSNPSLSAKGSSFALKQWFDECLFQLHKQEGEVLYEIAREKRFGLSRRLNSLRWLCLNGDSWIKSDEFSRIFTECCDGYEKNTTEDIYPPPAQVIRSAYVAAARKELSEKVPIELFAQEMDPGKRSAGYRLRLADAIEPKVNQEDSEDRLGDCLKWLKNDPDDLVKAEFVKMIENIRPLSAAARTKIEQAIPELPAPYDTRLREWLAKQKK